MGCMHIYTGDGKGKTTAAIGQAIRAAGHHIPVVYTQFLKDGTSGEIVILEKIPGIQVHYCKQQYGFYKNMSDAVRKEATDAYSKLLEQSLQESMDILKIKETQVSEEGIAVVLILDEILAAYTHKLIDRKMLYTFLKKKPQGMEILLTGRNPEAELVELADYVSVIKKEKHPYDCKITARKGIEY